jgi:glycosyltransferase involved in cell wall biosynthesis
MVTTGVEIVLPVHNEAGSVERTLSEFFRIVHDDQGYDVSFIVCEDGSTDGTVEVVAGLTGTLPIRLLTWPRRRGYSRAVVDGLRSARAELVGFIDCDGRCDPRDFSRLHVAMLDTGVDLVVGYRSPRRDSCFRRACSLAFRLVYKAFFPVRLYDPSCPYVLIKREALEALLRGAPGVLEQGFWWEFHARARAAGLELVQVPVSHRPRPRRAGASRVYRMGRVPRIAATYLWGLVRLRRDLRGLERRTPETTRA